jgi:hypothetical protein
MAAAWLLLPVQYVEVRDRDTGETYFLQPVSEGDSVRLSWIHSIEHTPWVEIYEVSDGEMALEEARVKSFGAGVDQVAPEVVTEDGWVKLRGTGRVFPALNFFYSKKVDYELRIEGRDIGLEDRVPHHAAVEVAVERGARVTGWIGNFNREG